MNEQKQPAIAVPLDAPVGPLAWIRKCSDGTYEGPIADCDSRMDGVRRTCGAWTPLYEQAELSPEFTDTARAALLWVLWHHQGGSSPVGQPIRFALGIGAHEPLSAHQVAEAERWGAMTRSATADTKAPLWWHCDTHGPGNAAAWGCPECVREMRDEIKQLRATIDYAMAVDAKAKR